MPKPHTLRDRAASCRETAIANNDTFNVTKGGKGIRITVLANELGECLANNRQSGDYLYAALNSAVVLENEDQRKFALRAEMRIAASAMMVAVDLNSRHRTAA